MLPAPMSSANEEASLWTEVRPSNRHERVSEVRERVIQEGLVVFDRAPFTIGRKIGEGGQGTVYEATTHSSLASKPVSGVVKKFKPLKGISQGHTIPQFRTLHFINVCKPMGVFFDHGDSLCVFMPRYSSDLRTLIDSQVPSHGAPFSQQVAVSIITKLAMGLKALHEYGIYHRDIKAANILVDPRPNTPCPEIYITDFENSADVVGTGFWRAPEILQTLDVFSEDRAPLAGKQLQAADVYSFGMTCYEILTGNTPFDGHRWSDYHLVLSGGRPELPDHVPEPLKNLIRQCWHQNPDARPSFAKIISLLQECDSSAVSIVSLIELGAAQGEASREWSDASPEACLVELKRILVPSDELHTAGLDIIPAIAKLQRVIAEFISISEEFESKFGWDSHLRHPSLPLAEYLERRWPIALMQDLTKQYTDGMIAFKDDVIHHRDRLTESCDGQLLLFFLLLTGHRTFLVSRMMTCILHDEAESNLSESESLTYLDKFAIVKSFINNTWMQE